MPYKMLPTVILALLVVLGNARSSYAQSTPKFEVASIKLNTRSSPVDPGNGPISSITRHFLREAASGSREGRFNMDRVPLSFLIELAYNIKEFQLRGGPSWATSDRYEVKARAEGNATLDQMRPMLQSLLADRFKLALHHETKEAPAYELVVARSGLKIVAAKEGSCTAIDPNGPLLREVLHYAEPGGPCSGPVSGSRVWGHRCRI